MPSGSGTPSPELRLALHRVQWWRSRSSVMIRGYAGFGRGYVVRSQVPEKRGTTGAPSLSGRRSRPQTFVIAKPVPNTLLRSHLAIALPRMEREHRRYFRHKVDLPITLSGSADTIVGRIMNVSEGVLAVTQLTAAAVEGVVTIQFELPGTTAQVFRAKAEVVWRDSLAIGLRFLRIEADSRRSFEAWLESLEGQRLFRESTH